MLEGNLRFYDDPDLVTRPVGAAVHPYGLDRGGTSRYFCSGVEQVQEELSRW